MYNFLVCFMVLMGLICNLHAGHEKEVDSLLDSISKSCWLSSTKDSSNNRIVLKENDDLYKVIRKKLIQTLQGKRIHSLVYVHYPDELGIATIMDYDENSVEIRLVDNEKGKFDSKYSVKNHGRTSDDIVSEWSDDRNASEAMLQMKSVRKVYEDMLQPRITGLLLACFSYEKKLDSVGIISLSNKKIIAPENAIAAGLYHDFDIYRSTILFLEEHAADWSKRNNILFETWRFRHSSFEEYFQSQASVESRLRWSKLLK